MNNNENGHNVKSKKKKEHIEHFLSTTELKNEM